MDASSRKIHQHTAYSKSLRQTDIHHFVIPLISPEYQWIPPDLCFSTISGCLSFIFQQVPNVSLVPTGRAILFLWQYSFHPSIASPLLNPELLPVLGESFILFILKFLFTSRLPSSKTNMPLSSIFLLLSVTATYSAYTLYFHIHIGKYNMENSFPQIIPRFFSISDVCFKLHLKNHFWSSARQNFI